MAEFEVRPDPIEWMDAYSKTNRVANIRLAAGPAHGSTSGHTEMSTLTGQVRIRYQYDQRWSCGDCRVYKERAEGSRIIRAFEDQDMWVSVVAGDRDHIREAAQEVETDYVVLPLGDGNHAVLTTSPLVLTQACR